MTTKASSIEKSWIQKTQTICGGDACIRNTRIPVWSVINAQRLGATEQELRNYFVTPLTAGEIETALAYYMEHTQEIDDDIRLNEEA